MYVWWRRVLRVPYLYINIYAYEKSANSKNVLRVLRNLEFCLRVAKLYISFRQVTGIEIKLDKVKLVLRDVYQIWLSLYKIFLVYGSRNKITYARVLYTAAVYIRSIKKKTLQNLSRQKYVDRVSSTEKSVFFADFEGPWAPVGWTAVVTSSSNTITEHRHKLCLFNTSSTNRQSLSSLYRSAVFMLLLYL